MAEVINREALVAIRRRSGITQADLAARAEISKQYMNDLESGRKPGSPQVSRRLADALGVPVLAIIRTDIAEVAS